ncbi:9406_t:CDS:2 [Racocetra fulgida]|uniref:9406_t:CDS:1 n=1 Tax=Racocetra fulgida TaxID=60492 RepID=A0A9N8YT52_9GLOM|nr:9406_t:CDS:2 [Racocetra fulgida]
MQELQQKTNEILQEEIRRAIEEKLSRFTFPCPHCQKHIEEKNFGKEQQAFHFINGIELEQQKIYENFPEVKKLRETIESNQKEIIYLQSPAHIENSIRVKNLQNQNQELQKQLTEKKEQIQNLVLRQKGQGKGQDLEKWFYEELLKVFDGQDRITDISKGQIGAGKRADFLQEVLTASEPKEVVGRIVYETKNAEKWDNNMVSHQADYGFIVATCEGDKIIRSAKTIDPHKKIYISGDNVNLFSVIKAIRELLITEYSLTRNDNSTDQEQKLKKIEEWASNKLPKYIIDLQKQLENQESAANTIIDKANKIKKFKEEIYRLAMSGKVYNALSFGDEVVIGELKEKKDILFSYNSCKYPSSLDNYLTFEGGIVIETVGEEIIEFGKVGETFTEAEETTPPPEEPTAGTNATRTGETGYTPQPETTGNSWQMPEQNTPLNLLAFMIISKQINQYIPGSSKDEKKMLFLSLIKSGLVNEDHIDSQRKFIKYKFLKNKLEEIYPQKKGSPSDGSPPSEDGLAQTKKNAIQTITVALNLEPAVKESELSSEFQG